MTKEADETKKHREEAIKALREMRDMMMNDDNWENMMRLVDAVTMGAFAIARLNEIDYGKYGLPPQWYMERTGGMITVIVIKISTFTVSGLILRPYPAGRR